LNNEQKVEVCLDPDFIGAGATEANNSTEAGNIINNFLFKVYLKYIKIDLYKFSANWRRQGVKMLSLLRATAAPTLPHYLQPPVSRRLLPVAGYNLQYW
jgi:hypothetical protein